MGHRDPPDPSPVSVGSVTGSRDPPTLGVDGQKGGQVPLPSITGRLRDEIRGPERRWLDEVLRCVAI
jgi:hypothetical protein